MALPVLPDTELFSHPEAHQSCHNLSPLLKKASQHPSSLPPRWLPARCLSRHVRGTAQGCWHAVGQDEAPGRPLAPGMLVPPPAGPVPRDQHPTHACWDPTTPWGNAPVVKVSLSPVPPPPPPSRVTQQGDERDINGLPSAHQPHRAAQPAAGTRQPAAHRWHSGDSSKCHPPGGVLGQDKSLPGCASPNPRPPPATDPGLGARPRSRGGGVSQPRSLAQRVLLARPRPETPPPPHPTLLHPNTGLGAPQTPKSCPGSPGTPTRPGRRGAGVASIRHQRIHRRLGWVLTPPPAPQEKKLPGFPPITSPCTPPCSMPTPSTSSLPAWGGRGTPHPGPWGYPPPALPAAPHPAGTHPARCSSPWGRSELGAEQGEPPAPPPAPSFSCIN